MREKRSIVHIIIHEINVHMVVTQLPLLLHRYFDTDSLYKIQLFHFRNHKFDNGNWYVNSDPNIRFPIAASVR